MPRWIETLSGAVHRATAAVKHRERNTGKVERRSQPTARPVPSELQIQYTPQLDGDPDPGEVVWTWVPFEEDQTLGKDRPVVIIGRRGDVLSGVALTTKQHDGPNAQLVEVGTGEWDSRHRTSYAKVDRLLDINTDAVRREGAILNRRQFDEVVDAVVRLHQVVR
jgi:hypothetical protein